MHILFLSDNFPPEVNAPASRTFEHCKAWVTAGHSVTVITGAPNFPAGRVFDGYKNRFWQSEIVDGIHLIRVWTYIAANKGFAKRVLDYLSFMVSGSLAALFVPRIDIVVGTSPQFFTACAACFVAAMRNTPWVFEVRDLWPASIKAVGAMKDSAAFRMLERVEMFLYRSADRIVTVSHAFKRVLSERGISADKIDVITNGVDVNHYVPQSKDRALVCELGLEGKFVAGYIGTHGMAHALDTLLDAARLLSQQPSGADIAILFLGDGADKAALIARARAVGLTNVLFLATVPKSQVARYWSLLDIAIIHLRRNPLFLTVIPSKLFECMGMGIPVVLGVEGESAGIVETEQVGELFEPENSEHLAKVLLRLRIDGERRRQYSANGPIAAKRYDRGTLAGKMLGILCKVAGA